MSSLSDDLRRPQAYPPPEPAEVTLEETHASWVFLAGDQVWKIKRPVNYGFLDYSDREKRRRCCEEEVRLGRRLAPQIYDGVVPVYQGKMGFSFVGPGAITDHAVKMKRLADAHSARSLLRAGRLGPPALRHLASRLAAFYAAVPATPAFGSPARIQALIDQNHRETLPWTPRFVAPQTLRELLSWTHDVLKARQGSLAARVSDGRIREGHGDLRLEHVYFPGGAEGSPLVIDPIEFNESFRCLDVALDVSFFAMELEACQRRDLACFFLSGFAQAANDYDFYPLLDLYLCYRAWVRAKVACFVAVDPGTPPGKARRKADEASQLFALAQSYTRPRSPAAGPVIAVGGQIAAGKSTIAEALGLAIAAPVVSSDATRKYLGGIAATEVGGPSLYTPDHTQRTYREVLRRAKVVLDGDRAVIIDATFRDRQARSDVRQLARAARRPFLFVEVTCDDETMRARLRARAGTASTSDAREELLPWMKQHYEAPTEIPPDQKVTVSGAAPVKATVDELLSRLPAGLRL